MASPLIASTPTPSLPIPPILPKTWKTLLPLDSSLLAERLYHEVDYLRSISPVPIYPPQDQLFRAFELTPPSSIKIVILGQDPYHTPGTANGLAFSSNNSIPPSLRNIYKEIHKDLDIEIPSTGDLTPWAERGVFLLNTTLSVVQGQPNSNYSIGWSLFTSSVIKTITTLPQPIVFLLWGKFAHSILISLKDKTIVKLGSHIFHSANDKYFILTSHPSPLSCYKSAGGYPPFFDSHQFLTANNILLDKGVAPVDFSILS